MTAAATATDTTIDRPPTPIARRSDQPHERARRSDQRQGRAQRKRARWRRKRGRAGVDPIAMERARTAGEWGASDPMTLLARFR
jgi:hypothetical protein